MKASTKMTVSKYQRIIGCLSKRMILLPFGKRAVPILVFVEDAIH